MRWNRILEVLLEHKLAWYRDGVPVAEVMVHPRNRSGLGINPFHVHSHIKDICAVGCDKEYLLKATAFESGDPGFAEHGAHLGFNQDLVESAAGLLAPLTGHERLASVATSHFTAGCRAIIAGCKTPEQEMADVNGCLNISQIESFDPVYARTIKDGWRWCIISKVVEQFVPGVPDLAQRALNAEGEIRAAPSEMETAMCIANYKAMNPNASYELCRQAVLTSLPPCADYIRVISDFVELYCGGENAPIVR